MDLPAPEGRRAEATESENPTPLRTLSDKVTSPDNLPEYFSLKDVIDRHREVTDKISTQVRTIAVGLLVFVWSMLNAAQGSRLAQIASHLWGWIGLAGVFSVLALFTDYVQYVLGKHVVDVARSNKKHKESGQYEWPTDTVLYRSQFWCFWGKQILCVFGVLLAIVIVFVGFYHSS